MRWKGRRDRVRVAHPDARPEDIILLRDAAERPDELPLAEGSIDAARELVEKLENVAGYCEWAGRVDWARGKKGKARKRWMTCTELSEEARAWCGTCDG